MSRYDAPPKNVFRGRSLSFVRTMLNKSGPLASSAFAFAEQYKAQLMRDPELVRPGMVCFFGLREPGDCGLYVGDGNVLALDPTGKPCIRSVLSMSPDFIGAMFWPTTPPKTVGGRNGTE
jgi:hypothetical protein